MIPPYLRSKNVYIGFGCYFYMLSNENRFHLKVRVCIDRFKKRKNEKKTLGIGAKDRLLSTSYDKFLCFSS